MSLVNLRFEMPAIKTTVQTGLKTTDASFVRTPLSVSTFVWRAMFACSAVALASSCYLAWASLTSSGVAGCSGGSVFDCDHVLHSRWSKILSIPVSIPAMFTHISMLGMLLYHPASLRLQRIRWGIAGFCAFSAALAAVWFVGVQIFWLEHLCPYCLVAHVGGILLVSLFLWSRPAPSLEMWVGGMAATAAISGMIALQIMSPEPKTHEIITNPEPINTDDGDEVGEEDFLFEPPKPIANPQAWLNKKETFQLSSSLGLILNPAMLLNGQVADGPVAAEKVEKAKPNAAIILSRIRLETDGWPLLGKPDAELVFVEMFDYTCEHCQRTHKGIEGARQKLGDRLAIIVLPVPMDNKCNAAVKVTTGSALEACDISKLAIAVWAVDRDKFEEFHNHLFTAKPKYQKALEKANELVDPAKLKATLDSSLPAEYVAKHISLYQKAGSGTIPKLMFPRTTSVGALESPNVIVQLIEQHAR